MSSTNATTSKLHSQRPPLLRLSLNTLRLLSLLIVVALCSGGVPATQAQRTEHQIFLPIIFKSASPSPITGEFSYIALSDANILPPEAQLVPLLQIQKPLMCQTPPPYVPQTYQSALNNSWTYLNQSVGQANLATFRSMPEAADADAAQVFAVAAVTDLRYDGALAALLIAYEKRPDPMILINTAGVLNMLGKPAESLAFLDRAGLDSLPDPLAIPGREVALSNRGHALLAIGRWSEAENVLRPIVEAETALAEARMNLSLALLCQNKDEEAAKFYRLASRRSLFDVVEHGEEVGGHIPIEHLYDRSAGRTLALPHIPISPSTSGLESMIARYDQAGSAHIERFHQLTDEAFELEEQIRVRQPTLPFITVIRAVNVLSAIISTPNEKSMLVLEDRVVQTDEVLKEAADQLTADLTDLGNQNLEPVVYYAQCRALLDSYWGSYKSNYFSYDTAVRAYSRALYAEQTGLAANLIDPLHHKLGSTYAKIEAEALFGNLLGELATTNASISAFWQGCLGSTAPQSGSVAAASYDESAQCPAFVRGVKLAIKVAELTINVNCEKIELETAGPSALSLFGQVTVDLKQNTVTAFVGAKVKVKLPAGVELSAKEGIYVRADRKGLTDVGMRVSTTGAINVGNVAGKIDGPDMEFSFVSAVQYLAGD